MLHRKLEPEVMETQAEAIAYDDMDHHEVNQAFVDDLLAAGLTHGEVLDLGSGTARIPLLLCDQIDAIRVLAVDLSVSMLDLARINIELSPHVERIMLDRIDAKSMPFQDGRFDAIISNSIVHHLPDPTASFCEAVRVCQLGGLLFFRDLARPASAHELDQLVQQYAGDESDHARQMFADSLHAALTCDEVLAITESLPLQSNSVEMTSDRHWTWVARRAD